MKKALTASALLNLLLIACLFSLLRRPASDAPKMEARVEVEVASNGTGVFTSMKPDPVHEQAALSESSLSTANPAANRSHEPPVALPLVFQEVDLSQLNLNRDQLQAVEDLRQKFLDEIGGLEQNPNDPAYRERWLKSQPHIDDDLRGMIGFAAFQNYQVEAVAVAEKSR